MPESLPSLSSSWTSAFWIITVASLTNVACSLVGCYLVLRRMSLLGDAISHAVLPGLVAAFLLTGTFHIGVMFAGALVAGLLTTLLTETIHRHGNVAADASMGVVFTSLFALGVVLISLFTRQIHLDAECVMEGLLDYVGVPGMNSVSLGGLEVPRQAVSITPVLLLNLVAVCLLWKELKITAFDPALATTMGIPAGRMHYLLMSLVALTVVASFEVVGSILVVAILICPPAAAHLLSDRLGRMQVIAAAIAVLTAIAGYLLAAYFDTNTAGMMASVSGALYGLTLLLAPRYGLIGQGIRRVQMSLRIVAEDLLALLYRLEEIAAGRRLGPIEAVQAIGGGVIARWSLARLIQTKKIIQTPAGLRLTDAGRVQAATLVRSHRLWETYLVEQLGLPADHVHASAERMEHYIDDRLRRSLEENLPATTIDPHGRDIPSR